MNDLDNDLDMEPYFRAWDAQKKAVESLPDMESGIGRALKHGGHRPFRKLLRREVACLIAAVVMLAWLLFNFSKGMEMPVAYIITLLLMLLCVADSVYALRLIALANPVTSSIPDMLKNCAKLRLYQKIELLVALVVAVPMTLFFIFQFSFGYYNRQITMRNGTNICYRLWLLFCWILYFACISTAATFV